MPVVLGVGARSGVLADFISARELVDLLDVGIAQLAQRLLPNGRRHQDERRKLVRLDLHPDGQAFSLSVHLRMSARVHWKPSGGL